MPVVSEAAPAGRAPIFLWPSTEGHAMWTWLRKLFAPKEKSDEEYVASVRKNYGKWHWVLTFELVVTAILVAAIIWFDSFVKSLGPGVPPQLGFIVGFMIGMMAAQIGWTLFSVIQYFRRDRTIELLLEYHDALQLVAQRESAFSTDRDPAAGAEGVAGEPSA
jgi:hypothetical protein